MIEEVLSGVRYSLDEDALTAVVIKNEGNESESRIDIPEIVVFNDVPYRVTSIGERAFEDCYKLTEIAIPNSVTEIRARAFANCHKLTDITIPDSVTIIGERAFLWCFSLRAVTIPGCVTTLGKRAFSGCGVDAVIIPDSVTSIGEGAFLDCEMLEEVVIGRGVTSIGAGAFCRCEMLSDFRFRGTVSQWKKIELGDDWNEETYVSVVNCADGDVEI